MRLTRPLDTSGIDLARVDLVDPLTHSDGDPHAVWHAMRERDPVRWQAVGDDLGFWSVTRFPDADVVMRDHTRFTSERGTLLNLLGKGDPAGGRQMAATDPPRHTGMREPMQRALAIKNVERYRDRIRQQVRTLLAPLASGEPYDFAEAMTALPMAVTGTMMDLPPADWAGLTRLTTMAIAPDDPEFTIDGRPQATLETAHRELFAYFQDIVRERHGDAGDDLISVLLGMEINGRRLGPGEILSNCYSLLLGANVTTPYVPTAAVAEMAGGSLLADWLAHPELLGTGVDEALRWASPANHFMRHALVDVELGGRTIRAGDAAVVWLGSANRDQTVFPDPYTFDLRRKPNRHIAFGIGPHYCVGHTVARVSIRVLFEELLGSVEEVEQVGPAEHLRSNFVAGIKHLPIVAKLRPRAGSALAAAGRSG